MIEKLILHIGQSKTGTSSLQALLSEERETLWDNGVLYPDVFFKGVALELVEHNAFAESLSGIMRYPHLHPEAYAENFLKQMNEYSCDTLLLSAESFFGTPQIWAAGTPEEFFTLHRKKIEKLKALLPAKHVHIVLYLRRQDLWLESAIGHIIRYEGLLGQKVYENDEQAAQLLAPHLDYLRLVHLWREIMDPAEFSVVPYERGVLRGEDTAQDFLARTGLDAYLKIDESIPRKLENLSWSAECLTIKKALNALPKSKVRERTAIDLLNALDQDKGLPRTRFSIAPEIKDRVWEQHKADNRLLAQNFGGPAGSFFSLPDHPPAPPETAVDPAAVFAYLRRFERAYYSPWRLIAEANHGIKGFFRIRFPGFHGRLKGIIRRFHSSSA